MAGDQDWADRAMGLSAPLTRSVPLQLWLVLAMALACLAGALLLPFVSVEFKPVLPPWLPEGIAERVREWLTRVGRIPVGEHHLWQFVGALFAAREYVLGGTLLAFALVLPAVQIATCAVLALRGFSPAGTSRSRVVRLLAWASRWSMTPVFIIATLAVFFRVEGIALVFTTRLGFACYLAFAILSGVATGMVRGIHPSQGKLTS